MIVGLVVIVVLGLCDKIVLAFLVVGHTHTDVDRIIGLVVTYVRRMDIPTFTAFCDKAIDSFECPNGTNVKFFEHIISMTDYREIFEGPVAAAQSKISGLSKVSSVKIVRDENEPTGVRFLYKFDSTLPGWLPRPVLPQKTHAWEVYFDHGDCKASQVIDHYACKVF